MCSLDYVDEWVTVFHVTTRRARKAHACDCCDGTIGAGTTYNQIFAVSDGRGRSEKSCAECMSVAKVFLNGHGVVFDPSHMPTALVECIEADRDAPEAARWQQALEAMNHRRRARAGVP